MPFRFSLFLSCLAAITLCKSISSNGVCKLESSCGGNCYETCASPCNCKTGVAVSYGGNCLKRAEVCQDVIPATLRDDCFANQEADGRCPKMVGISDAATEYATFDYRVDVRSTEEWANGHSVVSLHAEDLASRSVDDLLDVLGDLGDKKLLVNCAGGVRAFIASIKLLKYGFKSVTSVYGGGFDQLEKQIIDDSTGSGDHPTKPFCYLKGSSKDCPQPLPISHIRTVNDIKDLEENVMLVDARPEDRFPQTLSNANRVIFSEVEKFISEVNKDATLVFFCQKGYLSFLASKQARAVGWSGALYWIDNGGYPELKDIPGIESV